jgi:hypothetical protein
MFGPGFYAFFRISLILALEPEFLGFIDHKIKFANGL